MKTIKYGLLHKDSIGTFEESIIYAYNNNELEEVIFLACRAIGRNDVEPTKSNALHFLKQRKEHLPSISLPHIEGLLDDLSTVI